MVYVILIKLRGVLSSVFRLIASRIRFNFVYSFYSLLKKMTQQRNLYKEVLVLSSVMVIKEKKKERVKTSSVNVFNSVDKYLLFLKGGFL